MSEMRVIPKETLRTFIWWHAKKGLDYASVFAMACAPFGELEDFEQKFDYLWEQYGVRPLRH